nr:L567 [uncultured bacterium]
MEKMRGWAWSASAYCQLAQRIGLLQKALETERAMGRFFRA